MSCSQTLSGLARDCAPSKGGISVVYIANREDIDALTVTSGKITAITPAGGSPKPFYKYNFRAGTGSMTSTLNVDQAAGSNFVSTDVVLQFNRMETTKRLEIAALAVADLVVCVRDANGLLWYLGEEEPVLSSAGTGQTGTARADGNYYQITLQDNNSSFPKEILEGVGGVDIESLTN